MNFQWVSNDKVIRSTEEIISTRKGNYLALNKKAMERFKTPCKLYVGYDPEKKQIGVMEANGNPIPDVRPFHFTKSGSASAASLFHKFALPEKTIRFKYIGKEDTSHGEIVWYKLIGEEKL